MGFSSRTDVSLHAEAPHAKFHLIGAEMWDYRPQSRENLEFLCITLPSEVNNLSDFYEIGFVKNVPLNLKCRFESYKIYLLKLLLNDNDVNDVWCVCVTRIFCEQAELLCFLLILKKKKTCFSCFFKFSTCMFLCICVQDQDQHSCGMNG